MKKFIYFLTISMLLFACSDPATKKQDQPINARQSFAAIPTTTSSEPRYLQPGDVAGTYDTITVKMAKVTRYTSKTVTVDVPYSVDSFYTEISKYKAPSTTPPVVTPPPVITPPTTTTGLVRYNDWTSSFPRSTTDPAKAIITSAIGAGFYNTQSCCAYSTASSTMPGTNIKALRIEWRPLDKASSSFRAEVQSMTNDAEEGLDLYYGVSFYAETWAPSKTWGESIIQWHDNNGTSPPVGLQINGSNLEMTITNKSGTYRIPVGPFVVGKKIDWVFHIKWSTGSTGIVEVWRDGAVAMKPFSGPTLPATGGGYLKIGLNYWGATTASTPRIAYYGPFKVGKTFDSVK